jgi:ABC-2 type transport system ATP-binding protein
MKNMPPAETAVTLQDLRKSYRGREALNGLTLAIPRGALYGLIGPDGAGKTTAFRILCGILTADGGEVQVLGRDVRREPESIKSRIGYLSQRFSLYPDLTVDENLNFFAEMYEVPPAALAERKKELLAFSRLGPFQDRRAADLSGGMKQKLGVSCALVHTPELLVLDEPTTGVDPVSRRELWSLLYRLWQTGVTILLSTPYLDEAERCSGVALLHDGKLLAEGSPAELIGNFPRKVYEVVSPDRYRAQSLLQETPGIVRADIFGDRLHAIGPQGLADTIRAKLSGMGEGVAVREVPASMEDIYFQFLRQVQA